MKSKLTTFFMFTGQAESAVNFYVSVFDDAKITSMIKHGPETAGEDGKVFSCTFEIHGKEFMLHDSPPVHDFTFTPSISIFIDCKSVEEIDTLYNKLIEGGQALMHIGDHGFSKRFGWVVDRYGVSWQLNFA